MNELSCALHVKCFYFQLMQNTLSQTSYFFLLKYIKDSSYIQKLAEIQPKHPQNRNRVAASECTQAFPFKSFVNVAVY